MKTAIVHVIEPISSGQEKHRAWQDLDTKVVFHTGSTTGAKKLSECLWQIDVTTSLHILGFLVWGAHQKGLECKVTFLGDDSIEIQVPIAKQV